MSRNKITVKTDLHIEMLRSAVELYFKENTRTIYTKDGRVDFLTYNKHSWYTKVESSFFDIIDREYSPYDIKLLFRILNITKQSKDVFKSGLVYMKYSEYSDLMSRRKFNDSLSTFLRTDFLVETVFRYYYIINPKRVIIAFSPNNNNMNVDMDTGEILD